MIKIITSDNGIELEVCSLGVAVVNHEEETETWARLTDVQRVELAAALDPGRRGLHVRLDNQAATLATYRRECDEALRKKGEMVDRAVRAERERDAAVARADQLRDERDDAVQSCMAVGRERDEWKARAEQAENARDTVATRAGQLEKRLAKVMSDYQDLEDEREEIADQFATFRAEIVAEAVKARESAVPRTDIEEQLRIAYESGNHPIERIRIATDAMCDLFSVEAEQAEDPVEAKAIELHQVAYGGRIGFGHATLNAQEMFRSLARHVLGQEASSDE